MSPDLAKASCYPWVAPDVCSPPWRLLLTQLVLVVTVCMCAAVSHYQMTPITGGHTVIASHPVDLLVEQLFVGEKKINIRNLPSALRQ